MTVRRERLEVGRTQVSETRSVWSSHQNRHMTSVQVANGMPEVVSAGSEELDVFVLLPGGVGVQRNDLTLPTSK